jgi:hypothetical protein
MSLETLFRKLNWVSKIILGRDQQGEDWREGKEGEGTKASPRLHQAMEDHKSQGFCYISL